MGTNENLEVRSNKLELRSKKLEFKSSPGFRNYLFLYNIYYTKNILCSFGNLHDAWQSYVHIRGPDQGPRAVFI